MTEIYSTRYYSIGLITDEQNIVGIATDLKISLTSDGTVDEEASVGVTPKDLVGAEVVHDILVRESRRDRIRAKNALIHMVVTQ